MVIVYDITELSSFENVEQWIKDIQASDDDEDLVIMIIGNKSDLEEEREVTKEQGLDFAKKMNSFFMETSAKDFINVSESFSQLIDVILERQPKQRPLSVDESGFASSSASGGASSSNAGAQANTARDHFVLHQGDRSKDDKIDIRPLAEDKYPSKKKCC